MTDRTFSLLSASEQFREAIFAKDMTPPERIEADGKIHRFSTNGQKGDTAGWYVFRDGLIPSGAFGDFRRGLHVSDWSATRERDLSSAEQKFYHIQHKTAQLKREIAKNQRQAEAQRTASRILAAATAATTHPYLLTKDVAAYGLAQWDDPLLSFNRSPKTGKSFLQITAKDRQTKFGIGIDLEHHSFETILQAWNNILIVPLRDDSGDVQSLQFISGDGDKKFLYGGKTHGCFFTLGTPQDSNPLLIAEGYATAATVHEATGLPVIVAFNAGNLAPVAKAIRARYPSSEITLCADDDVLTKGNPGVSKAAEAAFLIGGQAIVPEFGANRPDGATDFNDMAAYSGKESVRRFLIRHLLNRRSTTAQRDAAGMNPTSVRSIAYTLQ